MRFKISPVYSIVILLSSIMSSGCVSVGGIADSLSSSVLNQNDPAIVRDGVPSYLILLDSMILQNPKDSKLLLAAARLNGAYASAFVDDPERTGLMSAKALDYARLAACYELKGFCAAIDKSLEDYQAALLTIRKPDAVVYLFGFASAWAGWVQTHSDDWQAIADLPKIEASVARVLALDDEYDKGGAHIYMGVLLAIRPASLGGQPEAARKHFECAIAISEERNLMAKVLFAEKYARLVFDQELHDNLLQQVLSASVEAPGLTLSNTLAQQRARELLRTSSDYF